MLRFRTDLTLGEILVRMIIMIANTYIFTYYVLGMFQVLYIY